MRYEDVEAIMATTAVHSTESYTVGEEPGDPRAVVWTTVCGAQVVWGPQNQDEDDDEFVASLQIGGRVQIRIFDAAQLKHLLAGLNVRDWEGVV